jgi:hypothetical protein
MKRFIPLLFAIVICSMAHAQVSGTLNIPGSYPTLADALNDLNTNGVAPGGVIFNLLPGNPQVAPSGGYTITTLTGSSSSTIVLEGNGNTVTAFTPQSTGILNDAIFKIIGADYVTIQGFVMQENSANTLTAAVANNMTEFGVALFYASQTNGAKYITIQNNTIQLNRSYQNTFGIYSNVRHSATNMTTTAAITSAGGAHDYTHIYGNTITNVNHGIVIIGSSTPAYENNGIDIGGTSTTTSNTISNFGTTPTYSAFVGTASAVTGININSCLNTNISYNSITSSNGGMTVTGNIYGIYVITSGYVSSGSYFNTINFNSISIKPGIADATVYGLRNSVGNAYISYDVSHNLFHDFGHTASGTGAIYLLNCDITGNVETVTDNSFNNISVNTTGAVYLMFFGGSLPLPTSSMTITNNNIVTGFSKTGSGATVYCLFSNGSSVSGNVTIANNNFSNITLTGTTALMGIQSTDGGAPSKSIHDNTISNLTGGTGTITGLNFNYGTANIYNNTFSNLSGGGAITVLQCGGTSASLQNIYSNTINAISSSGAFIVTGIQSSASYSTGLSNIYRNNIYNLSGSNLNSSIYGINVTAGTTVNIYNNFVSDLRASAASAAMPVTGLYISGTASTNVNVYYNTVYLAGSSSGSTFGSTAVYASTTPTVDLRNNILVNKCIYLGSGYVTAYRRSNNTLTTYSANSNANCFYAGTPGARYLIMYDGSNSYQTLASYQSAMGPLRDVSSVSELPPFLNIATTPYNLHLGTSTATLCESGGLTVSSPIAITTDYDGDTRSTFPDIGADEFGGIAGGVINPAGFAGTGISSQQIDLAFNTNPSGHNVVIVWNTTGTFSAPVGVPPAPGNSFAGGTLLSNGTSSPVSHTGRTFGTVYYYKAFSYTGSLYSNGITISCTPSVAPPTAFTATPVSSAQINLAYSLNAQSNNVVIATNSTSTFGTPANGTPLNVNDPISGGGTVIYVGPLSAFSHTGLTQLTTYYYKIWSSDAYNYYSSTGPAANATTLCASISSFPWTEGFESVTIPALPTCWAKTTAWVTTNNSNSIYDADARTGTQFLREPYGNTSDYVWTPGFALTGGTSYDFSFYWAGDTYAGWTGDVFRNTVQSSTGATQLGTSFVTPGVTTFKMYSHVTNSFTPTVTGTYYFAIRVTGTSIPQYLSFDDFKVEQTPPCPEPTLLTATGVIYNSANLGWTSSGTSWDIEYGLLGFTPTGNPSPGLAGVTNPYTLTGLTSNTTYAYYVRANCPGSLTSYWAGPLVFKTMCDPANLPFLENFDSYTVPDVGCGAVVDANSDGVKWVSSTGTTQSSPNKLSIGYSAVGVPMDDWYFTRGLNLTGGSSYHVTFRYRTVSGTAPERLEVKYGTSPTAAGMTSDALFSVVDYSLAVYITGAGIMTVPTSGIYYVGWHCFSQPDEYGIYIDNIDIELIEPCVHPTDLAATGITDVSANLSWTMNGNEYSWEYVYGPAPLPAPTGPGTVTFSSTTNPINGLTGSTTYQFYVRGWCGLQYSSWAGPYTFTTACSPIVVTSSWCEPFTLPVIPDCWTTSGAQTWYFANTNPYPDYGALGITDHTGTGGNFAWVDGSGTPGLTGITLTSPTFDITGMTAPYLSFYVFNNNVSSGNPEDEQKLVVTIWNGATAIAGYTWNYGTNNSAWTQVTIPFANPADNLVKITFVVSKNTQDPYYDDMLIDDVCLENLSGKTLYLTQTFPEGMYAGEGTLNPSNNCDGIQFQADTADLITVELHNSASYATIEYNTSASLSTAGTATVAINSDLNDSYYLTIRNRSTIETTSAEPVDFSGATINYSFNTQDQAYGSNMGLMIDGTAVIYSGDENQDGLVDGTDLSEIGNLADQASCGYLPQDLNGDGLIDGSDLSICGNNADMAIGLMTP